MGHMHAWCLCTAHRQPLHLHRDLKDMLSQFGKVLFVDEPRIMRVAVAHFARQEDRDQVLSGLKSASGLGGQIEMAPVRSTSACLCYSTPFVHAGSPAVFACTAFRLPYWAIRPASLPP